MLYYLRNSRNDGLVGPGALKVWRDRLLPTPQGRTHWTEPPVWLHVSGPGDARAAVAFLRTMIQHAPDCAFFVTCGNHPARHFLEKHLSGDRFQLGWLPFDYPCIVRRFLKRSRPRAFVGMQGECWPILFRELHREAVPSVLLRVDMLDWDTQTEFPKWVRPLYERMLSYMDVFSVRAPKYAERLVRLGVEEKRIFVGEDYRPETLPAGDDTQKQEYAHLFGVSNGLPLVVLAGPRLDEVKSIIPLLKQEVATSVARFLIAPVEQDELRQVEKYLVSRRHRIRKHSQLKEPPGREDIILLDTHGELFAIYSVAHAVIIGDTFPPAFSEGRNLWEPLVQGAVVLHGPELPVSEALTGIEASGFARRVVSYEELASVLNDVIAQPTSREAVRRVLDSTLRDIPSASSVDARAVLEFLSHSK